MAQGLSAIVFVGEKVEEKDENKSDEVIHKQLSAIKGKFIDLYIELIDKVVNWDRITIAYEPIWTYNTGRNISPDQVQDSMEIIKKWLKTNVSPDVAAKTRLLYAGSINEKNSTTFLEIEEVDGIVIGSKSTDPKFREMFESCAKIQKYQ